MGLNTFLLVAAVAAAPSGKIDSILAERWQAEGVAPSPVCNDSTFLRRVSLDLIGRIPTTKELQAFRARPDRTAKIDELLRDPLFSRHLAETLTASLVGYTRETPADREVLKQWLESQLEKRVSFGVIATELIAAEGQSATTGPVNFAVRHREDTAVQVCRQFLGVRLDCARCHDHPFARWTQQDLELMSRFFEAARYQEISEGNIRLSNRPQRVSADNRPRMLTGARPRTAQWRKELALFVTHSKPFARNFANRIWYHLMGRGIVHPPDDFHKQNPAMSPELLEYLANESKRQEFKLRKLIRLICNSDVYQRESTGSADSEGLFAKRVIKPLTPEQLYDSQYIVLGVKPAGLSRSAFVRNFVGETIDEDFLLTWKYRETVRTLLESVTGDQAFGEADNQTIDWASPAVNVVDLDVVFQRVLSRPPTKAEADRCKGQPLGTVLFCLMQTNEFVFNH